MGDLPNKVVPPLINFSHLKFHTHVEPQGFCLWNELCVSK